MNTSIGEARSDKRFQGSNVDVDYRVKNLFLFDLDGTLVKTESGKDFPVSPTDIRYNKMVLQNLKEINEHHPIKLVIVTNQGGIEAGFYKESEVVERINNVIKFLKEDTLIEDISYQMCITNDKNSPLRKPNTGMLENAAQLTGITDKDQILFVGDASGKEGDFSDSDYKAAVNFGVDYLDVEDFQIKCTCGLRKEIFERKCKEDPNCWEQYQERLRLQKEREEMLSKMTDEEREAFIANEILERKKAEEKFLEEHPEVAEQRKKEMEAMEEAMRSEKEEQERRRKEFEEQERLEKERRERERSFLDSFGAKF